MLSAVMSVLLFSVHMSSVTPSSSVADCCSDQCRLHRLLGPLWPGKLVVHFPRQQHHPTRSESAAVHVREELHGIQPRDLLHLQPELPKRGQADARPVSRL